jgi:acyl-CoA dehydrogenase
VPAEPVPPAWATLSEEEFRLAVRAVLAGLTGDQAAEQWERDRALPRSVWRVLGENQLLGLGYSPQLGGSGAPLGHSVAFLSELGRTGYGGFRTAVAVHSYMANHYLGQYASPWLQQRYLAPALAGLKVAALAITEPDAGSDLAALSTSAVPDGEDFLVTGNKSMVVNGSVADYYVLACRTSAAPSDGNRARPAGISLLVVDADLPGVTAVPQHTLGWRSAGTAAVSFDGVRVAGRQLIGRAGAGFYQLLYGLQYERLAAAAMAVGGTEYCLQVLVDQLRRRSAHGRQLAEFQAVRHRVAALATEAAAARELVAHAARCFESAKLPVTECSMAKLYTTELASRAADACLQLHGSAGYLEDSVAARLLRDTRAATIAAGPSEVMYDLIAGSVLDAG